MALFIRLTFMAVALLVIVPVSQAEATEAIMPVKVRIIRCVSYEERLAMCHIENLCCNLLDRVEELASAKESARPDASARRSNPKL